LVGVVDLLVDVELGLDVAGVAGCAGVLDIQPAPVRCRSRRGLPRVRPRRRKGRPHPPACRCQPRPRCRHPPTRPNVVNLRVRSLQATQKQPRRVRGRWPARRSRCRSACDVAGSPADGAPRPVRSEVLRYEQCGANLGLCNVIRRAIKAFRERPPQHARNCWCLLAQRSLAAQPLRR